MNLSIYLKLCNYIYQHVSISVKLVVHPLAPVILFSGHQGMVIDEAQKIKNHGALVSRAMKEVGNAIGHTRIALSGAWLK